MKKLIFAVFLAVCLSASAQTKEEILLSVDREFAKMSKDHGAKTAFSKFLAENTEFIMDNAIPMTNRAKIIDFFGQAKWTYWIPQKAVVSKANDLATPMVFQKVFLT